MRIEIDTLECASVTVDSGDRHYVTIFAKPGFTIRYVAPDEERGTVMIALEPQKVESGVQ